MDFDLPETALAVRDGVAAVAAKYDHAYWSRCEEEHRFPQEAYDDLAAGGWFGLAVPEEYGGGGQGLLELAVANETLCASGGTAGSFFYITTPGFGGMTITRHGTDGAEAADPARPRHRRAAVLPRAHRARRRQQRPRDHHVRSPRR